VGDDVVICDEDLARVYMTYLEIMGVPVSMEKSLVSDTFAEFAGRIITADKVYIGHKYGVVNDDNFVDITRQLGPSYVRNLKPFQRQLVELMAPLPEPVGFGWNPKGLPIEQRITSEGLINLYKGSPVHVSDLPGKTQVRKADFCHPYKPSWVDDELIFPSEIDQISLPSGLEVLNDLLSVDLPVGRNLSSIEYELRFEKDTIYSSRLGLQIAALLGKFSYFPWVSDQQRSISNLERLTSFIVSLTPEGKISELKSQRVRGLVGKVIERLPG